MAPVNGKATWASTWGKLIALAMVGALAVPALQAQSRQPDAVAAARRLPAGAGHPRRALDRSTAATQASHSGPAARHEPPQRANPVSRRRAEAGDEPAGASDADKSAPPPMPPIETVPPGSVPRNQINPKQDLYTISTTVNFVQLPVMVRYSDGRPVDGLLARDFTVKENGKPQTLTYFTSDPFELSVAIVLDIGIADVALQKINQTYSSLVGAFSPYDEVALYTYSSTVSQVTDFSGKPARLTAALERIEAGARSQ